MTSPSHRHTRCNPCTRVGICPLEERPLGRSKPRWRKSITRPKQDILALDEDVHRWVETMSAILATDVASRAGHAHSEMYLPSCAGASLTAAAIKHVSIANMSVFHAAWTTSVCIQSCAKCVTGFNTLPSAGSSSMLYMLWWYPHALSL